MAMAPSLDIEYSMLNGDREVLVRSFTIGSAGAGARYRVLWEAQGRRFLVLADAAPPQEKGRSREWPRWPTGETVLFFHDRLTEAYSPVVPFRPEEWEGSPVAGGPKAIRLPVVVLDAETIMKSERLAMTGEVRLPIARPPTRERVLNFTIHPNTQNLRREGRAFFAMPPVRARYPSPNGRFSLQLTGGKELMVLLTEGERFRDQIWVLLFHFRIGNRPINPSEGTEARAVWSADSRHVLLLTRGTGAHGLATLPGGKECYLLFDTVEWNGVLGPSLAEVKKIGFDLPSAGQEPMAVSD
jgi:hypothetical protein